MHTTKLLPISLAILSLLAIACTPTPPPDGGSSSSATSAVPSPSSPLNVDKMDRESVALGILDAMANSNWGELSTYIAGSGVRFTPYTYVNEDTDQTFTPSEIANFGSDQTLRVWGVQEGSGFPIEMTIPQYWQRYVFDHDYRTATDVRWNHPQDRGSMIDNVQAVYPGASVVEYNFPGFDPQYGGMDWRSLRLVLAQADNGEWKLHGIIHDEWTP